MKQRRAYILIIVLGFAAVATSLGMAFLNASSTVMPEAMNYQGALRAGYIASSGIALASHYVMYPPTTVNYGQYWTGANNINIGAGNDYVNVTVQQNDPNLYHVVATGVALDPNGATRAKKQITADVLAPLTGKWQIPYAYFSNGAVTVPSSVQFYGDAHSNAALSGTGWTQSKLTSFTTASWSGTGPPASITSSVARYTPSPSVTSTYYSTYTIQGKSYTAYTGYSSNSIDSPGSTTLNAVNMGATNPGRIIMAPSGTFRLKLNAQITGTLVVSGTLELDDAGIQITPLANFPALVVSGDISLTRAGATAVINGAAICSGKIMDNNKANCKIDVTGACLVGTGFSTTGSGGLYRFYWNQSKATFWDFQGAVSPQPVTILNWLEN